MDLGGEVLEVDAESRSLGGLDEPPRMRFNRPPCEENRLGFVPASLTDFVVFVGEEKSGRRWTVEVDDGSGSRGGGG